MDATAADRRPRTIPRRLKLPVGLAGAPALVLAVVQGIITAVRLLQASDGTPGARNLEAVYHVLLTAAALRELPLRETLGLPVVTLGGGGNAGYPWAAAVATPFRIWIYTSFPPGSFWLAALVTSLPVAGTAALLLLNGALGASTAILLGEIVRRTVAPAASTPTARLAAIVAGLAYLLSGEGLQSHGPVYWAHSALQPILAAQVLLLVVILERGVSRRKILLLIALTIAGGYTEWTEYVFALLAGAAILVIPPLRRRMASAGLALVVTAPLTGAVLFLHFTRRLGAGPAIDAWTRSADARADAPFISLVDGVILSVGGTLLSLLVVGIAALVLGARGPAPRRWLLVVALFALPCVENVLLRQHATQFTFDRLKDVVPVAAALGYGVTLLPARRVFVSVAALVLGGALSLAWQVRDEAVYSGWHAVDVGNRMILAEAARTVPLDCAAIGTSGYVRGYLNVITHRSIVELSSLEATVARVPNGACGALFIDAGAAFQDLPYINSVTVVTRSGVSAVIPRR